MKTPGRLLPGSLPCVCRAPSLSSETHPSPIRDGMREAAWLRDLCLCLLLDGLLSFPPALAGWELGRLSRHVISCALSSSLWPLTSGWPLPSFSFVCRLCTTLSWNSQAIWECPSPSLSSNQFSISPPLPCPLPRPRSFCRRCTTISWQRPPTCACPTLSQPLLLEWPPPCSSSSNWWPPCPRSSPSRPATTSSRSPLKKATRSTVAAASALLTSTTLLFHLFLWNQSVGIATTRPAGHLPPFSSPGRVPSPCRAVLATASPGETSCDIAWTGCLTHASWWRTLQNILLRKVDCSNRTLLEDCTVCYWLLLAQLYNCLWQ